jgi:aryl-alcohol dehydrogenase-like predicted oxidoreductase
MPIVSATGQPLSTFSWGTGALGTELTGDAAFKLMDAYVEAGGNCFDSAHVYAAWVPGAVGVSERALGEWIESRGVRDQVIVSTKGGHPPMDGYPHAADFLGLESLRSDVSDSLDRLRTDYIDLYYLHRDDGTTPVEEIIDSLNDIPALRALGASNFSTERVEAANRYAASCGKRGFESLQNQWSLAVPNWPSTGEPRMRYIQKADAERCSLHGLVIHAYSPTASELFRGTPPDSTGVVAQVRQMAEEKGRTPVQIALAWLLSQDVTVVPILGTTKLEHLRECLDAVQVRLEASERDWLRAL